MLKEFSLKTDRSECLIDITGMVAEAVKDIKSGIAVVYCPHTTAGITINESADPDVRTDILLGLRTAFFDRKEFRHMEGNSHAHIKSSVFGASQTIIVENGRLLLGTWQAIYFCEFDGGRQRRLYVKLIEDKK